ncbi:MAG TPA: hypothetical protein VGG08_01485 [Solirubrobacteraceae bacterium]
MSVTALGVASPAMATPKGPYAVFQNCPTKFPGLEYCIFGQVTSGEVAIGSTSVPISKTITIQSGALPTGTEGVYFLIPATNGESLSKTALNVPGGLLDIVNCKDIKGSGFFEIAERLACEAIFENHTTGVTATTELVATATNPAIFNAEALLGETGTALTLPVRVHLSNPLLGSGCYIGSESNPVQLHLTTGTTSPPAPNKPIKGKRGEFLTEGEGGIIGLPEVSLVDNSFSAPKAEGCGGFFSFLIDPIVDAKLGLPSAAGHNTAILNGSQKIAAVEEVVAHE